MRGLIHTNPLLTLFVPRNINYRPQRGSSKVVFLHLSVILSRGCISACTGADTPWADTPPHRTDTNPPPSRRLLQRTVRILLECILVSFSLFYSHRGQFSIYLLGSFSNLYSLISQLFLECLTHNPDSLFRISAIFSLNGKYVCDESLRKIIHLFDET